MYHKIALLRHWEKCNNSGCMPSYETLFISADASVTGAQGYVYWRPGDPICARLVRNILLCVCCYCYSALL